MISAKNASSFDHTAPVSHLVLFKLLPGVDLAAFDTALSAFLATAPDHSGWSLIEDCGLREAGPRTSDRCVIIGFESAGSFRRFLEDERHARFTSVLEQDCQTVLSIQMSNDNFRQAVESATNGSLLEHSDDQRGRR